MNVQFFLSAARKPVVIFISGAVVFGAMAWLAVSSKLPQPPFELAGNMAVAGATAIGNLLVVALVLERALSVFDQLFFGDESADARQAMIADPQSRAVDGVDVKRDRARLILGLAAGFFISAAGVRTLANLVATKPPGFSALQTATDICLTAGLLAGGSNALAKLFDALKERAAQSIATSRLQSAQAEADRQSLRLETARQLRLQTNA